ncbi:class I SAM-dependent methyltransferase [Lutimonas zeaxanthinifaciens]|uniref:class I SAM-dependent methyltransferase n=1 Tax=Lutimonas zeaxanthinifaciens TaxID=3060215 RepID=UPI00265CC85D|nr:class I SAM-dependent methyltransferase [Lutimonas sp. YSD2104]WKK67173.1 class I SAM-dependent methyltransferase [Lutimonas sp. YSD2104]
MNYIQVNKKLWDQKTEFHYESEFYNVEDFIKNENSLNPIEIDLLGNLTGKSLLHLQCHFGQDSISLNKLGAEVTAVDFSSKAIERARELNNKMEAKVRFIESDVYKLPEVLDQKFDIVYTSYGVLGWLPDMKKWAEIVSNFLKPGGILVLVEFHPVVWMFSDDFKKIEFKYSDKDPIIEEYEGTYADRNADMTGKSICWNHGLSIVMDALIQQKLEIKTFEEFSYSPYDCFENTVEVEKGKYMIKGLEGKIPMIYSVKAVKK